MKWMKKILILIALSISLMSCTNKNEDNIALDEEVEEVSEEVIEEVVKEVKEAATGKEQFIANAIIEKGFEFHNPASIKVVEVSSNYGEDAHEEDGDLEFVHLRIQGENKVGGTLNDIYILYMKDWNSSSGETYVAGTLVKEPTIKDIYIIDEDVDITIINDILKDHWESKGLL